VHILPFFISPSELKPSTAALLKTLHALLGISLFELAQKQPIALQQRLQEAVQQK